MGVGKGYCSEEPGNHHHFHVWWFALPLILAAAAYLPTLFHDITWDDPLILANIRLHYQADGLRSILTMDYTPSSPQNYFRPLTILSLWLDDRLGGKAFNFHLTNLLLYLTSIALIQAFLFRFYHSAQKALFGSLIFAVHPLHSEAVCFISARSDLLAAIFVLCSLLCWLKADGAPPRKGLLAAGSGLFTLALLCKETAFVFPLLPLAWDLLDGFSLRGGVSGWIRRNLPWILAWTICIALTLFLRWEIAGISLLRPEGVELSPVEPSLAPSLFTLWARLLTFPIHQQSYYTLDQVQATVFSIFSTAFLLFIFLWPLQKRDRRGLKLLVLLTVFLIPVMGFLPIMGSVTMENFLFLPSLAFCGALGASFCQLLEKKLVLPMLGCLLAAFLVLTFAQNRIWKDDVTLFRDMTRTTPGYPQGWEGFGVALSKDGQLEEAVAAYRRGLSLNPNQISTWYDLGLDLFSLARYQEAAEAFGRALSLAPNWPEAKRNQALARQAAALQEKSDPPATGNP